MQLRRLVGYWVVLSCLLLATGSSIALADEHKVVLDSTTHISPTGQITTFDHPVYAAPITLHSRFTIHDPMGECDQIWITGLTPSQTETPNNLGLRWIYDCEGFMPKWILQLVLPGSSMSQSVAKPIVLANLAPKTGHSYAATLSYDPAGRIAVSLNDITLDEKIVGTDLLIPPATAPLYVGSGWIGRSEASPTSYFTLEAFNMEPGYQSQGLPYALRSLYWRLLADPTKAGSLGIGDFFADQPIGLEITWPDEMLAGEICVSVKQGEKELRQACVSWNAKPQTITLGNLPLGSNVVQLDYVSDGVRNMVATQTVEVLANKLSINLNVDDRRWLGEIEGKVIGAAWITSARAVQQIPVQLVAKLVDENGKVTMAPALHQKLDLTSDQPVKVTFDVAPGPDIRRMEVIADSAPGVDIKLYGAKETTLPAQDYALPVPTFIMDFETTPTGPYPITEAQGVAAGRSLDLTEVAKRGSGAVPYYTNAELGPAFSDVGSFTVSGWVKERIDFNDLRNRAILNIPGFITLYSHGEYKGRLGAALSNGQQIWSSWFSPYLAFDRWVFFAFTYDSTKVQDNAAIYVGSEKGQVEIDQIVTSSPKHVQGRVKDVIVGATSRIGSSAFSGAIDNLRVDVSRDGSAALSRAQVEAIRKSALNASWLQHEAEQTVAAKLQQAERNRQLLAAQWSQALNSVQVDTSTRVYPDQMPEAIAYTKPSSVPRGGTLSLQFVVMAQEAGMGKMEVSAIKGPKGVIPADQVKTYRLIPVMVEANSNGGSRTSITSKPPALWMETFLREAPFETYEPLEETDQLILASQRYQAVVLDVAIPKDAEPGLYQGQISFSQGQHHSVVPFTFNIHKTVLSEAFRLNSVHWLQASPENLTNVEIPAWWSERHWELLQQAGNQLKQYGDNTMLTPLIADSHPLIQTIRLKDRTYQFDFHRFDRWMETFLSLGYKYMAGVHLLMMQNVYIQDADTKVMSVLSPSGDRQSWYEFLPSFLSALYKHLEERNWTKYYLQHVLDEPRDPEGYSKISEMVHALMPGVKTIDAVNGSPAVYSPFLDVHVFGIASLAVQQPLAKNRLANGKETWLYHCASPYPPAPNTHLDERVLNSRVYPWMAYLYNAKGYLFWGANMYRGADPYATSIGPVPGGSQNPGHQPGDNWFFYLGPEGLRSSLRMVAFREGMLDYTMLAMLAEHDKERADRITQRIARSMIDYATDPNSYHEARTELLTALDNLVHIN